jgi:hypothetical protein
MEAASILKVLVTTKHDVTSLKNTIEIFVALQTSSYNFLSLHDTDYIQFHVSFACARRVLWAHGRLPTALFILRASVLRHDSIW